MDAIRKRKRGRGDASAVVDIFSGSGERCAGGKVESDRRRVYGERSSWDSVLIPLAGSAEHRAGRKVVLDRSRRIDGERESSSRPRCDRQPIVRERYAGCGATVD